MTTPDAHSQIENDEPFQTHAIVFSFLETDT